MVAVVRGVEDVSVVQLFDALQLLHQLLHHVVHGQQRLPPAGRKLPLQLLLHKKLKVPRKETFGDDVV